jgi:beta-glucanase (GH16 family)
MLNAAPRPARWLSISLLLGASLAAVPAVTVGTADAAATSDACGVKVAKASGGSWSCTFVDNFDAATLDSKKWTLQDTTKTGFYTGDECYQPDSDNIAVRGGALQLTAQKVPTFSCKSPYGAYNTNVTSGMVTTYGKFAQTYGKFEVRAKFPTYRADGLSSAFWMAPIDYAYGAWPASGEIDVVEWFSGAPKNVTPSLHYTGSGWSDTNWTCEMPDVSQWHTYGVEWTSSRMKFYYDGRLCFDRAWTPDNVKAPAPFDKRFGLVLQQGVSRVGTPNGRTASTPFPSTMSIDYVKAWS